MDAASSPAASAPAELRGEDFYQRTLDTDSRDVPVSLRATSAGYLEPRPIEPSRFFDRAFHALEVDHVWARTWQMACREEQIPTVGDSILYEVADTSLIVVRADDDRIRAYHNSCLHRGTQLRTSSGRIERFRCPYHGFSWNLDGSVREITTAWDFPQIDHADFCLPEAQVDTWGGFVFVNPDPGAMPLSDYLGVLPEHFATWPLDERYLKAHIVRTMPCNWKVALEAFIEAYHTATVHPQLRTTASDSLTEYDIYGPHISRMVTAVGISSETLEQQPEEAVIVRDMLGPDADVDALAAGREARAIIADGVRRAFERRSGRSFDGVSDAEVLDGIEYFVFPNFMPWGGYLTPFVYRFLPDGHDPDSCLIDIMVLEPIPDGEQRPPAAATRVLSPDETWADVAELGVFGRVFNQDGATFRRVQRGLRASVSATTTLARYQDSRIRHFHATLDAYIAGDL